MILFTAKILESFDAQQHSIFLFVHYITFYENEIG